MANRQAQRRLKDIGKALGCIMLTGKECPSHSNPTVTGMKERKLLLTPEKTLEKDDHWEAMYCLRHWRILGGSLEHAGLLSTCYTLP